MSKTVNILILVIVGVAVAKFVATFALFDRGDDMPDGFERLGGQGPLHFVYVAPKNLGEKILQRKAGRAICKKYNNEDYCEVYMWKVREDVPLKMPILRKDTMIGLFTQKNGKVRLKSLQ